MSASSRRPVRVSPSGFGPYGLVAAIGRHIVEADEPEHLGGRDTGPDPYELVMAGLGACTAMTLRMYADRHGWPLERVEVEVQQVYWTRPDKIKVDRFERTLHLHGALTAEQRARLVEIADRCPVSQTLQKGSMVTTAEAAGPTSMETAEQS